MDDPILRALLKRTEPKLEPWISLSGARDDPGALRMYFSPDFEHLVPAYWFSWARAWVGAREALDSGDDETIAETTKFWLRFEHSADMAAAREAADALPRERGKKGSKPQTAAADAAWAPYQALYWEFRGSMSERRARAKIKSRMNHDDFKLPATGKPPSAKSICQRIRDFSEPSS